MATILMSFICRNNNLISNCFFLFLAYRHNYFFPNYLKKEKGGADLLLLIFIIESFLLVASRDAQLRRLKAQVISVPCSDYSFAACCRPRHPVKVSESDGCYPVPSSAQLFTVLSHRRHLCHTDSICKQMHFVNILFVEFCDIPQNPFWRVRRSPKRACEALRSITTWLKPRACKSPD